MEKQKSNTVFVITYLDWEENELYSEDFIAKDVKTATKHALSQHKKHKADFLHIVEKGS